MAKQRQQPAAYVKRQTLTTSVVVALMVGFVAGVVFGVYKSPGPLPSAGPPHTHDDDGRERMLEVLSERVRSNPNDVEAWIQIGNIHFDGDRHESAIQAYEKALEIQPGNAGVLTDLGIMYRLLDDPEEAVRQFDKAIAADPTLENPRYNKGVVLFHDLKNPAEAVVAWQGLLALNPQARTPNGQPVAELVASIENAPEKPASP